MSDEPERVTPEAALAAIQAVLSSRHAKLTSPAERELGAMLEAGFERALEEDRPDGFSESVEELTRRVVALGAATPRSLAVGGDGDGVAMLGWDEVARSICPLWPFCK